MSERNLLRGQLKLEYDATILLQLKYKIELIENQLSDLLSDENVKKIKDNLSLLSCTDGSMAMSGVWKIKKKIFPKHTKALPIAKIGPTGRLVSSPAELKNLYLSTYKHRLRHRPIKPGFQQLKLLKEELCSKRLQLVKLKPHEPWTNKELVKVLQSLKNNKSRDPHSLINEIFKPGVIGSDLQQSLLLMFNKIKEEFKIPEMMQMANIISIFKGKGEKNDLQNDRGIFIMNIFKSIMMKMIYNQEYETIDSNMSDSNIGARRGVRYQRNPDLTKSVMSGNKKIFMEKLSHTIILPKNVL